MASYADYDLARSDKKAVSEDAKAELVKDADETIKLMKKSGYHTGFGYKYPWGSNMTVANQSELLQMTYNVTGDELYKEYAKYQLDYLFGTNSLGYCFVTGYGTYSPEHPHHRPSEVAEGVITGMLVGGPNGGLEDPYAKTVLLGQAPAMCYVDSSQSYSTNEVAIYWNSPLIYALSAGR
jgi:Glycosyl hydrolase family 9.